MERARESIFKQFIEFFKSFSDSEINEDERISEESLSDEDKKLLKNLRAMDKVSNIREKYVATVSTKVAKEKAASAKDKKTVEKTIDEK